MALVSKRNCIGYLPDTGQRSGEMSREMRWATVRPTLKFWLWEWDYHAESVTWLEVESVSWLEWVSDSLTVTHWVTDCDVVKDWKWNEWKLHSRLRSPTHLRCHSQCHSVLTLSHAQSFTSHPQSFTFSFSRFTFTVAWVSLIESLAVTLSVTESVSVLRSVVRKRSTSSTK